MDYLPKDATIEQACNWLQAKTGQAWILPRLLECHLTPHFWLDYKPGYPAVFGDRIEGYQTRMMFQGDLCRLESDGADALVNMFAAHDGSLIKTEPGLRVPLSELRFKRDRVERVAEIINNTAPAQNTATPAPVVAAEAVTERETRQAIEAPKFSMSKAALIAAHEHEWPTIRRDIAGASTNGLAAAKAGSREWWEAQAMDWAKAKGKLTSAAKPAALLAQTMNSMASIPGRRHKLEG